MRERESASRRELKLRPMTLSGCSRGFSVDVHRKKKRNTQTRRLPDKKKKKDEHYIALAINTRKKEPTREMLSLSLSLEMKRAFFLVLTKRRKYRPSHSTFTQHGSPSRSRRRTQRERSCLLLSRLLQDRTHTTSLGTPKEKDGPASSTSPSGLLYIPDPLLLFSRPTKTTKTTTIGSLFSCFSFLFHPLAFLVSTNSSSPPFFFDKRNQSKKYIIRKTPVLSSSFVFLFTLGQFPDPF